MDRRNEDRERRGREGSWGRDQSWYEQHDRDRDRYRQSDEYMHDHERRRTESEWRERSDYGRSSWEHGGQNPSGGGNDRARFDYGDELRRRESRFDYGSEERRGLGEPRPGDGEGWSRVGGPRREEPYRSPSRADEYGMYREGNHSGYDTWHGHNYYQSHNDAGAMGSRPVSSWQRSERRGEMRRGGSTPIHGQPEEGGWQDFREREHRDERLSHGDRWGEESRRRGELGWSERGGERGGERGRQESWGRLEDRGDRGWRDDERRGDERRGDFRSREEGRQGDRDISRTWRTFDSWGDTDYSDRRGQGFGWRRSDDYGDHFWSHGERSRDDR